MLTDHAGFAIPFTEDDAVIECGADDADYGPPESWPEWTDEFRFTPIEADSRWAAQNLELPPPGPTDEDLEEMAAWSATLDRLEAMCGPRYVTDADVQASGLPVG